MNNTKAAGSIKNAGTALGIEFGSTRIKAVLIDENYQTIASGSHEWEVAWSRWYMDLHHGGYLDGASELLCGFEKKGKRKI